MIQIRAADMSDLTGVLQVHERAFGRSDEARLVALLQQAGKAVVSLVAGRGGIVAGSIVFSPVTIRGAPHDFRALGLAPVAVLPDFQRKGIGSELIREGLTQCARAGYDVVVVLGDPRYYSRFGFSRAADHGLDNEYRVHDEFMVIGLRERALEGVRGLVQYAPEFG